MPAGQRGPLSTRGTSEAGGGVFPCIICHSSQPVSQRVTLLFFFTEKKKRSKKRKEFALHLYYITNASHEDYTENFPLMQNLLYLCGNPSTAERRSPTPFRGGFFPPTKLPRRGKQAAAAAVTLPFLQLKLGRKVSGDPPQNRNNASSYRICT